LAKYTYAKLPLEKPKKIGKKKKKKKGKKPLLVKCFCRAILYYSQSGDDSQEDLAKFEYKRNKKLQF